MGDLDAGNRSLGAHEGDDRPQGLFLGLVPKPQVSRRYPSFRAHSRRLDNHHSGPAHRPATQVNPMPLPGHAVLCHVLAHGRDDDPILKLDAPEPPGGKKTAHGLPDRAGSERRAATWPVAFTPRRARRILPSGPITKVLRSIPMRLTPYIVFSLKTP